MAVTAADCERMIEACETHEVKVMIAYRLHFEDVTLSAFDFVRKRRIGEPKFFNSSFAHGPVNGRTTRAGRTRKRDQFGAQLEYFSDCVLRNRTPEPSGYEGLQDVRIIEALYESAETGKAVAIPPFQTHVKATRRQRITKPGVRKPMLVHAAASSVDQAR